MRDEQATGEKRSARSAVASPFRDRNRQTRHCTCPSLIARHTTTRQKIIATGNQSSRGYTMIELVVVIVILGVIAAIAGPRFFTTRGFSERGYADEVASAMRVAQKIAVGSGCNVRLTITTTGYNAMQQAASGNLCNSASSTWSTVVRRYDGGLLTGTPPTDANVSGPATMVFNNRGSVVSGATNLTVGAYTLNLDAATGFVVVQ